MKPRYTKRVREEAALICAIAASTPDLSGNYDGVREALGLPPYGSHGCPAWTESLERNAWLVSATGSLTHAEADAEAASIILDGWSPGDPL